MMAIFIAFISVAIILILWIVTAQRKLVVLNENVGNAMCQIGVQLSSRFDVLMALVHLTKNYAEDESKALIETVESSRSEITAKSTPEDVLRQEGIINEALGRIALITEQYPELISDETYIKALEAMQAFENMLRTSRLIYNDSVTKLNREIRMFPVLIIAGMLGFKKRGYLEERAGTGK